MNAMLENARFQINIIFNVQFRRWFCGKFSIIKRLFYIIDTYQPCGSHKSSNKFIFVLNV